MKQTITRNIIIDDITPEELARIFTSKDSGFQAEFFNEVAKYVKEFYKSPFCFQLEFVTNEEGLTKDGREIMEQIGNYSH